MSEHASSDDQSGPTARSQPRERGQRHGIIGEFDSNDECTAFAFTLDPARLGTVQPMNVWPTRECIATSECRLIVRRGRHSHARANRVAGAQQGAEVGVVGHPQRSHNEMIRTAPRLSTTIRRQILWPRLRSWRVHCSLALPACAISCARLGGARPMGIRPDRRCRTLPPPSSRRRAIFKIRSFGEPGGPSPGCSRVRVG